MTKQQRAALRRLSKNSKLAFELTKELNREVARSHFDRSIFCSVGGSFYIAWKPDSPFDEDVMCLQACDFNIEIGDDCEYESFDEIEDDAFQGEAIGLQEKASVLLSEHH